MGGAKTLRAFPYQRFNASGNAILAKLVAEADAKTLEEVLLLLEPDGVAEQPLDLGIAFPKG